ncbi:MAG: thrB [Frankiales bacterium]|nr:thrB [Frankiales bacterium]
MFLEGPVHVRVPATSANLGPGFDSAGLALSLHDDVVVRATGSGLAVDVQGEGAVDVARGERHLVVRAMRATFDRLGGQPAGLEVRCTNRIPHARGLGSSSAAIVSGIVAACGLVRDGDLSEQQRLDLADELEGHPDNVAACLRGGATFAWSETDGPRVVRLDAHADLAPVAFVPSTRSSTKQVRGLLPPSVPYADAVLNASRAALLPHALTADPSLLLAATEDRLHQGYRAPAMPASATLMQELRAQGVPAVISGAGPTVLALTTRATRAAVAVPRQDWQVLALDVEPRGAHVVPRGVL